MKSESDKLVVCGGSCSECEWCLWLYLSDAEIWDASKNILCFWVNEWINEYAYTVNIKFSLHLCTSI